jgi:hypothetical protein
MRWECWASGMVNCIYSATVLHSTTVSSGIVLHADRPTAPEKPDRTCSEALPKTELSVLPVFSPELQLPSFFDVDTTTAFYIARSFPCQPLGNLDLTLPSSAKDVLEAPSPGQRNAISISFGAGGEVVKISALILELGEPCFPRGRRS